MMESMITKVRFAGVKHMSEVGLFTRWLTIYRTANPVKDAPIDSVSRWMLITRACVFNMTLYSGMIAILLAMQIGEGVVNPLHAALVLIGLVLAHAGNNMVNDLFDTIHGVDTSDYPRANYAPHPLLHDLISRKGLIAAIICVHTIDLAIAIYFWTVVGDMIWFFVLGGLGISIFYVAKPFRLKSIGLGELAILIVWGPLIVGGAFWALAGNSGADEKQLFDAMVFSLPYALIVMAVVMGKHMDKYHDDKGKRVRTLPVLLGLPAAQRFTQGLIIAFFLASMWLAFDGHYAMLLTLLALPRAVESMKMLGHPVPASPQEAFRIAFDALPEDLIEGRTPDNPPENLPIWPLWYVIWAFHFVKRGGAWFTIGLMADTAIQRGIFS